MAKSTSKSAGKSKGAAKRTLIAPKGDKRYVKRDKQGRFTESNDQGKSLSQDIKRSAQTKVKPGYGDKGDQPEKSAAKKSSSKKGS